MTSEELTDALKELGWWRNGVLPKRIRVNESTVRHWLKKPQLVPEPVADWLRALVAAHRSLPPPVQERAIRPGRPLGGGLWNEPGRQRVGSRDG